MRAQDVGSHQNIIAGRYNVNCYNFNFKNGRKRS